MALEMNSFSDSLLRQRVVAQINSAREGVELDEGSNSSEEMEHVLFTNAKSREEYMQLIAALVLHFNEKKKMALRKTVAAKEQHPPEPRSGETIVEEAEGATASEETKDTPTEGATKS